MSENWTKGPWIKKDGFLYGAGGKMVVFAKAPLSIRLASPVEEEIANGQLAVSALALYEALKAARDQFLFYADQHLSKHTPEGNEKAITNQEMADACDQALSLARGEG